MRRTRSGRMKGVGAGAALRRFRAQGHAARRRSARWGSGDAPACMGVQHGVVEDLPVGEGAPACMGGRGGRSPAGPVRGTRPHAWGFVTPQAAAVVFVRDPPASVGIPSVGPRRRANGPGRPRAGAPCVCFSMSRSHSRGVPRGATRKAASRSAPATSVLPCARRHRVGSDPGPRSRTTRPHAWGLVTPQAAAVVSIRDPPACVGHGARVSAPQSSSSRALPGTWGHGPLIDEAFPPRAALPRPWRA